MFLRDCYFEQWLDSKGRRCSSKPTKVRGALGESEPGRGPAAMTIPRMIDSFAIDYAEDHSMFKVKHTKAFCVATSIHIMPKFLVSSSAFPRGTFVLSRHAGHRSILCPCAACSGARHLARHSLQKVCPHVNTLAVFLGVSAKGSKQTVHSSAFFVRTREGARVLALALGADPSQNVSIVATIFTRGPLLMPSSFKSCSSISSKMSNVTSFSTSIVWSLSSRTSVKKVISSA